MQQNNDAAYLIIQLDSRWTDILRLHAEQKVVVGRASDCQIVVRDERVSRQHATIYYSDRGWVVRDLDSRNGTQVSGELISGDRLLVDGNHIVVGGCRMLFTHSLSASSTAQGQPSGSAQSGLGQHSPLPSLEHRNTQVIDPTIVHRLDRSQWSSSSSTGLPASGRSQGASGIPVEAQVGNAGWSFFYRLVLDLVQQSTPEAAAQLALDRLLEQLQISSGGVVTFDTEQTMVEARLNERFGGTPEEAEAPAIPAPSRGELPGLGVLAARQGKAGSYRRVSDFLVQAVIADRQAVLARNVQDDSMLGVAHASGQREVVSVICAPLRDSSIAASSSTGSPSKSRVMGLVHLYTLGEERMLSEADLAMAVGVADYLAVWLARLQADQRLQQDLLQTRRKLDVLEEQLQTDTEMVGTSRGIRLVQQSVQRAAPTSATVLIRGESGVGKELVARAVHRLSKRQHGPFVCLNCAALAPTLLESELFGHEKGAFTGATDRKIGKFEAADGGTLFLDEIGEMSPELQAKFLRVLEGQPFERLGGNKAMHTDVRVIAATNRNLEEAVAAKEFRSDLYFRLRVIEILVPPLRERPEDIPILVEHFIKAFRQHAQRRLTGVQPRAMALLNQYQWPGNIRELRNVIERAVVLGNQNTIDVEDLSLSPLSQTLGASPTPSLASDGHRSAATIVTFEAISLAELEQRHILAMLEHVGGNKSRAAQLLGIERSTLDRKLKRLK